MYWKITKDLLFDEDPTFYEKTRVGLRTKRGLEPVGEILKVRLLDDDRELYYEAEADDEALESLYNFAYRDAGVTILQVKKGNAWKDEIG